VNPALPRINAVSPHNGPPLDLPAATVGVPYSALFCAADGNVSTWSVAPTLPSWLTLPAGPSLTDTLSGTPPAPGNIVFAVTSTDNGVGTSETFILPIDAALAITNSPTAAAVNVPYTFQFTAAGGSGSYSWTAAGLPSWLTLSSAGVLSGTPTAAGPAAFTVTVTDSMGATASAPVSVLVNPALQIVNTSPLPAATAGNSYSVQFTATGGTGIYTWTGAQLPSWLTVSSAGVLTGTPPTAGPVSFTVIVTDSASNQAGATFTLPVNASVSPIPLAITTASPLAAATSGTPYSQQFTATGGTGGYIWTASGLPTYLNLTPGGLLTGTPTVALPASFTVTATDSSSDRASETFLLIVNSAEITSLTITTTSPLPGGTVGVNYSFTLAASGAPGPYTWTGANLPEWLSLSKAGVLSGVPPSTGTFTFGVSVTAADGSPVSKTFSIVVSPANTPEPLHFTTLTLPACTVSVVCSASIGATGGTPPYTFSLDQTLGIGDNLLLSPSGTISGTPGQAASLSFTVTVTDAAKNSISHLFTIRVTGSALDITSTSLPAGTVNAAYSATLQATGGGPAYHWSILSGSLPPGLTLSAPSGAITGTPTSAGSSTFSVQVTSGDLTSEPASLTITIASLTPLTITGPLQLPVADTGTAYSESLTAIGGTGGYSWTVTAGALPAGLNLATSGAISGTPATVQTASFTATVTDSSGKTASGQFTLMVIDAAMPSIITSSPLPDGVVDQPYDYAVSVLGGTPPYTWSIAQGTIPDGLTFNSANGSFFGTPTTTGAFTFQLTVTDSSASNGASSSVSARVTAPAPRTSSTKTYTIHVVAVTAFHITTSNPLPNGTLNEPYAEYSLQATGGSAPYVWRLVNGNWPPGIYMDASGNIGGTPAEAGTYSAIVQATDTTGLVATSAFSLTVGNPKAPAISIAPAPANGTVGTAYSQGLSASGGATPYSWSIATGSLPPGLGIDAASGAISGTPTQKGGFPFTVQVTDANGVTASAQFTISIVANDLQITTTSPLPNASVNVPYSYGLTVTGGSAPYTWSLSAGSLVSGFSIDPATGVLSGTPTQTGSLHFNISVTDNDFDQTSQSFDLTVAGTMLTISTTQTTFTVTVGSNFTTSLTASQGGAPYTWSVVKGTLPPGIGLNAQSGALTGTPTTAGTYTFTVQVTDATTGTAQVQVTVVVQPVAFAITTASPLPAGTAGTAYSVTFAAAGSTGAITWGAGSGTPPGLTLGSSSGVLSGTPSLAGDFSFSVSATDSTSASNSKTYQLHIAGPAAIVPTASGLPSTVTPGDQPAVTVTFANATTLPITLTATLQLSPSLGAPTDLLFSNGSQTMQFTIPPGTTQYNFSFQAGTVAGTIQLGLTFEEAGVDVTPTPAPALSTQILAAAPSITSLVVTDISGGIQVVIDGLSTTRDMKTATFQFTPAAGATLQTTSVTVDVSSMFASWYQNPSSLAMGSQFSLTIPFTISGNVNTIASVSATLTNSVGTSAPVSGTIP
jgi:hypothetical protein